MARTRRGRRCARGVTVVSRPSTRGRRSRRPALRAPRVRSVDRLRSVKDRQRTICGCTRRPW
ncbi:hypothetical protein J2X57_002880 [Luteibacter sp. 1214]|nr:hypothetical protein [Luteibacter sp. 1214]